MQRRTFIQSALLAGAARPVWSQTPPVWGGPVVDAFPLVFPMSAAEPDTPVRVWGGAEFLLWWIRQGHVPPLVTASGPDAAAILGPGTTVLLGGSHLDDEVRTGGRLFLGAWLDPARILGVEAGYQFLGSSFVSFQALCLAGKFRSSFSEWRGLSRC